MIPKAQTVKNKPKPAAQPPKKETKKAGSTGSCCGARSGEKPTKG